MRIRLNREKIRGKMKNKDILTIYGPKKPSDAATSTVIMMIVFCLLGCVI